MGAVFKLMLVVAACRRCRELPSIVTFDNNMKKINIDTPEYKDNTLLSAEPEDDESSPVLRVILAVVFMCITGCVIGLTAALLAYVMGYGVFDRTLRLGVFLALFGAAAAILWRLDLRIARRYKEEQARLLENARSFDGKVIGCEKISTETVYANALYTEVTWRFVIEYTDENGEAATVKSPRYYNDLSQCLADVNVKVLKKEDGAYSFGDFKLKAKNEDGVKLPISEIEED